MDKIGSAATQTTDVEERKRLYAEWNQMFIDDIPAISSSQIPSYIGVHRSLHGVVHPFRIPRWDCSMVRAVGDA